jgi:ribonuclease-3
MDVSKCEFKLGVVFRDRSLLLQALVHGSYINENQGNQSASNERMEFLGDAVLGMVMAEKLYASLPSKAEGTLTGVRASLVRRESLATAARALALGECILMGHGEEATGGQDKDRNLADAFEAVVGAIYLDQGLAVARAFVLRHLGAQLDGVLLNGSLPNYNSRDGRRTVCVGSAALKRGVNYGKTRYGTAGIQETEERREEAVRHHRARAHYRP